jgi:hypothetical protein
MKDMNELVYDLKMVHVILLPVTLAAKKGY